MIAPIENLETKTLAALESRNLKHYLVLGECQWLHQGDYVFVEIVSFDAEQETEIQSTAEKVIMDFFGSDNSVQLLVRSKWGIESVDEQEVARTQDGGIRAATVVPIRLKSGGKHTLVHVVVSMLAEKRIREIFAGHVSTADAARAYAVNALGLGGTSYWDPVRYPELEISSAGVGLLAGMLKKVA